jgi:hypothetical protein
VPLWVQFRYWVPALPAEVIAATCSAFFLYRRLSRAARRPTSAGPPTGIALLV